MLKDVSNIIVMGKSGAGKQPRVDVLIRTFGLEQLSTGDIFRKYLGLYDELGDARDLAAFYDAAAEDFIADAEIKGMLSIADRADADDVVLGLKAKYYVNQGLFVPDHITNALFEAAFRAMDFRGAVLDGYPRTVDQAKFLMQLANAENIKLDAILLVDNEDELIINRTLGRRICKSCGELFHMEFRPPPEIPLDSCQTDCDIVQRSDDNVESLKARLKEFSNKALPAIEYLESEGIPRYTAPGNLPDYSPARVEASVFEVMGLTKT